MASIAAEQECISRAYQAKLIAAEAALGDLRANGMPFDSPLSGLGSIEWGSTFTQRAKTVAFLPVALVLVLVLTLLVPIAYIGHLNEVHKAKAALENRARSLRRVSAPVDGPVNKNLLALWILHGPSKDEATIDHRLDLLSEWIRILYDSEDSLNVNLRERLKRIKEEQREAHYKARSGPNPIHVTFVKPFDELLCNLSEEFGSYC